MSYTEDGEATRPLRISKPSDREDSPRSSALKSSYSTKKIDSAIGAKTSTMRNFWSNMEKTDTAKQSPVSPRARTSPSTNRNSRLFENNIFVQSDRTTSGSTPSPLLSANSNTPNTPRAKALEELERTSSIIRNGSLSRLHGPRQFSVEPQQSPSKMKKNVTFNNSAQVIQYETVTPDISTAGSFESRSSDGEGLDDDDDAFDNSMLSNGSRSEVRVSSGRPLPKIPQFMSRDSLRSEDSDKENDLPVNLPGASYSDSDYEESDVPTSDAELPKITDPRPLPNEGELQKLSIPSELSRQESLLDSERRVETQYVAPPTTSAIDDAETTKRTMSQRRRSLQQVLSEGSRVGEDQDVGSQSEDEPEPEPQVEEPIPEVVEATEQDDESTSKSSDLLRLNSLKAAMAKDATIASSEEFDFETPTKQIHDFETPTKPIQREHTPVPNLAALASSLASVPIKTEPVEDDENLELAHQLDQMSAAEPEYDEDVPLAMEDEEELERSGTVIHRPGARKISPYLYYEQPSEQSPHVPYRFNEHAFPEGKRLVTPPAFPVPDTPVEIKQEPRDEEMPEIAATSVAEFTGLPQFENTTPLMDSLDEHTRQDDVVQPPSTTMHPQSELMGEQLVAPPAVKIKEEPVDTPAKDWLHTPDLGTESNVQIKKEEYESPVPSLDNNNSPNSYESPVKTEQESPATPWTPEVYHHEPISMPSLASEFESEFTSFAGEKDLSFNFDKPRQQEVRGQFDDPETTHDFEAPLDHGDRYDDEDEQESEEPEPEEPESAVPKTIRASSGSRLRTRPSLTPMEVRRISSSRRSLSTQKKNKIQETDKHIVNEISRVPVPMLQLDVDSATVEPEGTMFGDITEEFDRLLSSPPKRGYTLRENESIVVASGRRVSEQQQQRKVSSAVKPIAEQPLIAEDPPPLPPLTDPAFADAPKTDLPSSDRGRLFVRVVSIKDIDLPSVEEKRAKFSLTLDNGIHCITTQYKPLKKTAFLDQEFELTVGEELEFILTVKTKYTKSTAVPRRPVSQQPQQQHRPTPSLISQPTREKEHKRLGFSKLFGSPKKKNQGDLTPQPSPMNYPQLQPAASIQDLPKADPWESLVAADGSFGRCYVAFGQYQKEVYGRPATFEIPCFNEWAKAPGGGRSKRQPYKIGKMQVQMMFVPRASRKETLPSSIKDALEQLREARKQEPVSMEGNLSQLGGDCKYWRRRIFKLEGTMLTAYSESSKKPRAMINLSKAMRVIDDKTALVEPTVQVGKNRRKSAFAEQEEAFMFVDEGFRVRFANGEIIDFYADNAEQKENWIDALQKVVGTAPLRSPWTDLVMKRVNE